MEEKKVLIKWTSFYSVGIDVIDEQHKKLVDIINSLFNAFLEGKANDIVPEVIKDLVEYTSYHFQTEEIYFDKFNFPDSESHKNSHKAFVEKAVQLKNDIDNGKAMMSYDVMNFIKKWLVEHILKEDKLYAKYFADNGVIIE